MNKLVVSLGAAMALFSAAVLAHGDHPALHGGSVQVVADIQYELVRRPDGVLLYVIDHGKPADTSRMTGKLTVLQGTSKSESPLQPAAGSNALRAAGLQLASGAKVIASIRHGDGKTTNVRFALP